MTMLKTITLEPAFVIHTQSFSESSVIAVLFTRHFGKISVIAKGAQRPKSKFKLIKTPATLFSISSRGKTDLQTLSSNLKKLETVSLIWKIISFINNFNRPNSYCVVS